MNWIIGISTAIFCTLDVFPLWCADSLEKAGSDSLVAIC